MTKTTLMAKDQQEKLNRKLTLAQQMLLITFNKALPLSTRRHARAAASELIHDAEAILQEFVHTAEREGSD